MTCYIHRDGTFDLKIHAVVVWGGGNLYNLNEMERKMIFYKTIKKNFPTYSVLDKSAVSLNCGNFCRTTPIHERAKPQTESHNVTNSYAWTMKTSLLEHEPSQLPNFRVIHFLSVFLSNTKGFETTFGLQVLPICQFRKYDVIYAALTTIIARWITLNLKIRPNVCNMCKPANIRVMARLACVSAS